MVEIVWDNEVPEPVEDYVAPLLNRVVWLCPLWMQYLHVGYYTDRDGMTATMNVESDYRRARLQLTSAFLTGDNPTEDLIHEMVHCFNAPLGDLAKQILVELGVDETLRTVYGRQITSQMEKMTQDFAYVIARRLQE